MKEKILRLLKSEDQYLSGEEISNLLGVSRTAVWKHINTLKTEGYVIESQTKLGYRLLGAPDRLYPEEIKDGLNTEYIGRNIDYHEAVDSTNQTAKEMAEREFAEGTVVVAEMQTAGKGRLGRKWNSPFGTGIWMSLIVRPPIAPPDAPKITLLTAVAVAEGIVHETGMKPGIKWPNDVLVNGKKVCGILTEMKADMDRIHYVVVGMGINVNDQNFPEEIRETATSLQIETGSRMNRARIAASILNDWEKNYQNFLSQGFAPVKDGWKNYAVNLGKEVSVTTFKETISGRAMDIDEDGMLLVKDATGKIHRIVAGDVSLRK
ncbi:biotin--[acetyl-CoA-carboxylase] ligase [Candidatus Formimonas warabiya]|nr:biotin--[acetyl-CoA-carboxylase] ligase [Candidatus Formimonas warabiya]